MLRIAVAPTVSIVLLAIMIGLVRKIGQVIDCPFALVIGTDVSFDNYLMSVFNSHSFPLAFPRLSSHFHSTSRDSYENLYRFVVRSRFDDFVQHWRVVPPFDGYFDLMDVIPIDSTGCDRNHFFSLLNQSYLIPDPTIAKSRHRLCVFLMLLHQNTTHIDRFIARLNGEDFLFVLSIDAAQDWLRIELMDRFKDNPNVFFSMPEIARCRACVSLAFLPWMAATAVLRAGFQVDWFSLHSGHDAVLHSRWITKEFLLRYRGKAEFYGQAPTVEQWIREPSMWPMNCRPAEWVNEAGAGLRSVFRNWTVLNGGHLAKGSQWWTLSQSTVKAILDYMWARTLFMLRLSFVHVGDEWWTQSLLKQIGVTVHNPCRVRYIRFHRGRNGHPDTLTNATIENATSEFALSARKLPDQGPDVVAFLEDAVRQEGDRFPDHLAVREDSNQCGMREWARVLNRR
jgi:hypothetical protein